MNQRINRTSSEAQRTNSDSNHRTIAIVLAALSQMTISLARQQSYDDVLVVINSNSTISDSVGTYFATQRAIPSKNIVRIAVSTSEEIDSLEFENLRQQVESFLTHNPIQNKINYIVTTKGVPLKVNRGGMYSWSSPSSSVESELALILGPYAGYIGKAGKLTSPYYNVRTDFTQKQFGFYLVTRLDGYSYASIKHMIDGAASVDPGVFGYGKFVLDADGSRSMVTGSLNGYMKSAVAKLATRNVLTELDSSTEYLTRRSNVLGYVSWGSNDANQSLYTDNAKPYHTFLPGSIAETYVSTSARSFATPPEYGQSLIADLLAQGVNGVKGYVYEPYSSAIANVEYTFPMYADGFTMAESFYSASLYLSWMDVVIGDPKMRVNTVRIGGSSSLGNGNKGNATLPVELVSFSGSPSKNVVVLEWNTATEVRNAGFEIERKGIENSKLTIDNWVRVGFVAGAGTSNAPQRYSFTDGQLLAGQYSYRLRQVDTDGSSHLSNEISIVVVGARSAANVMSNFPNPFNPSTTIRFTLETASQTVVRVFNVAGQQVANLVNEKLEAGDHTARFNAEQFPSGVYFVRLETDQQSVATKIILAK